MDVDNNFVALGASRYRESLERLQEPMSDKERVRRAQDRVVVPFAQLLQEGAEPQILATRSIGKGDDTFLVFLQLDDAVFPVVFENPDRGPRRLRLTEPLAADQYRPNTSLAKLFDQDPDSLAMVDLKKGYGSAQVRFSKNADFMGAKFADELWDVTAKTLVRARQLDREKRVQRSSSDEDIITFEKKGPAINTRSVLAANEPPRSTWEGPPLGDTLLGAVAWRNQLVSVTGYADGSKPVQPMIRARVDGEWTWVPIQLPEREDIPFGGCAVTVEGNMLHLWNGLDDQGDPLKAHWSYDLSKGAGRNFPPSLWKKSKSTEKASAWPVVAQTENQTFVGGGVQGFFANRKPDKARSIHLDARSGWTPRAQAPGDSDLVGCSATIEKGTVFIGPGTSLDGVVRAYNDERGGSWFTLDLPEAVGCGQIEVVDGRYLQYRGGFDDAGKPHKGVWELDLSSPSAKWERKGDSDYVMGSSRVLDLGGSVVSIAVTPKGKQCFTLR